MLPNELAARLGKITVFEGQQIGPLTRIIGLRLNYAGGDEDVVDDGTYAGTWTVSEKIPAGSVFKFAVVNCRTAFAGGTNTTAYVVVGVAGTIERFSSGTNTDNDLFSAGVKVLDMKDPADAGSGCSEIESATSVIVTVTVDNDYTAITAGAFDVFLVYEHVPYEACE